MKQYIFVYGSLRKGFAPPEIAETADRLKLVGEGFVYGKLYDLDEYRALVLNGEDEIFGQILELPDDEAVLQKLDEYEGFDPQNQAKSLFVRKQTTAYSDHGEIPAWIYEYNQNLSDSPMLESKP